MNIQFDQDTLTAIVDHDTYRQLTRGTEFQQSISLLVMLNQLMEEAHNAEVERMKLTPKQQQQALNKLATFRQDYLKLNPPPGIDPDALQIFCD
jgi:hypothetical protein